MADADDAGPKEELEDLRALRDILKEMLGMKSDDPTVCPNCEAQQEIRGYALDTKDRIAAAGQLRQVIPRIVALKQALAAKAGDKGAGGKLAGLQAPGWAGSGEDSEDGGSA